MKQKSPKRIKINEKYYIKKNNIDVDTKLKRQKIKNLNNITSDIDIVNKLANETTNNNNKNLEFKKRIIKLLIEKNIHNFKNKEDYDNDTKGKYLSHNSKEKQNNIFLEKSSTNNEDNQYKDSNYIINKGEHKEKGKSDIIINKENFGIKKVITPIKSSKTDRKNNRKNNSNIMEKKILYKKNNIYKYSNRTLNELEDKDKENNDDMNLKGRKGTFSFNSFYRIKNNNNKEKKFNDFEFQSERNFFENKLKDRSKQKKKGKIINLELEKVDSSININSKEVKNENNIISLNFRSDKRSSFKKKNRLSTSSEKEKAVKNGALKILELLRNKKSEKIILKQNLSVEKKKEKVDENYEKQKNKEEKVIKNDIQDIDINTKKVDENKSNKIENNNNENKEFKTICLEKKEKNSKLSNSNRNIYNEIIEEVKGEKNLIQKIVHRKIIEGVRGLKNDNCCNIKNRHYNVNTYRDTSNKTFGIQNIFLDNFYNDSIRKENNVNIYDTHSNFLSYKKEKNNKNFISEKKYNKYKTFDNENNEDTTNDNLTTDFNERNNNENRGVRIKKIKLDKLKNKRNSLNYIRGNNININLNLNNKIINIHNNQKIYAPKRAKIVKKASIDASTNPIHFLPNSPIYKNSINLISPRLYSKNEYDNNTFINNIKPFDENSIFVLDKNYSNNPNNGNSINNNINHDNIYKNKKEKVKNILYSKVKVNRIPDTILNNKNKNLNTCRYETIRYIKKSKNKFERINSCQKKNKSRIIKIQQFGISLKPLEKNNNSLDKTEPINFNLNSPFNKPNQLLQFRPHLSNELNEETNINTNEYKKINSINLSHLESNNGEEIEEIYLKKNYKTGSCKLGFNYSFEKIMNNVSGTDDINNKENDEIKFEQIISLLSFEDLLIIEDKMNLILKVLEKGNKTYEEYFDLWNYFYSSALKSKFEQIFKYFKKETKFMKIFVNYYLIFIMICYNFASNSIVVDIDNDFSLIEIAQIIYTNLLVIINCLKIKITMDNKDNYNIRLIELSKIDITIRNKLSNIDNDISFIREILHTNINLIIKKIELILNNNKINNILNEKDKLVFFNKIKNDNFDEINKFFLENILKEEFLGCSILAYTYLKENQHFKPASVPYLLTKNKKKYSLVLDLDETLLHFKVNQKENEEGVLKLRPGVFTFLEKVGEFYEIILFTEASEAYTQLMLEAFNKKNNKFFDYKLYRQHCIIIGQDFIKDLSRIGRPLDKTIIIDNIGQNFKMQKSNGIVIKPFLGEDQNDQALIDLIPILINIARDDIDIRNGLMKYRDEILTKISSNLFRRNKQK